MRRGAIPSAVLAAGLALVCAGCPLPQPVPSVQRTGGQTVTPPRILVDTALPGDAIVVVRPDCPRGATIPFSATVEDLDLDDTVEVRWFVDYSLQTHAPVATAFLVAAADGTNPLREVQPLAFEPAVDASRGTSHVVELVVSNGFYPITATGLAQPGRSPLPGYETQVFRWFVLVDPSGRCE
jgi:hypothetical protein